MNFVEISRGTSLRPRWAGIVLGLGIFCCGMGSMPLDSWGQDQPATAPGTTPPAATAPAAPAAAAPATPPAAATTPAPAAPAVAVPPAPGGPVVEPQKSYLAWMVEASGPFGACIAIESFVLVALVTMNLLQLRREAFVPTQLVEDFEGLLVKREYQEAYDLTRENDSLLGKVLAGGMARVSRGYDDAVSGMNEVVEEESMHLEHKLSYLGLIVTTAPMLGLLGTVQGMIESFRVIATSDTAPKPRDLADGIATALFTTLEGLIVAIPAIFAYGLFRNQISRLIFEVEQVAETLMGRFATMGKKAGVNSNPGGSGMIGTTAGGASGGSLPPAPPQS